MDKEAIKRFADQIVEQAILDEVERKDMPQIGKDQLGDLQKYVKEMGFLVTKERVDPDDLKATQEDYSQEKVDAIVKEIEKEGKLVPALVSETYAILDGHHRGRAVRQANESDDGSKRLPVIRLHLETEAALQLLKDFEKRDEDQTSEMEHVVVQAGRFHPFHEANYRTYESLCDRFGKNNVYVATSGRTSPPKMPFTFKEKKRIMSKLYPIPKGQIVEVKNAYNPEEVLEDRDPESTCFVMALNEKSISTLKESELGEYFQPYDAEDLEGFGERGYYYESEPNRLKIREQEVSESNVYRVFSDDEVSERTKRAFFKEVFGSFDEEIFEMVCDRFNPEPLSVEVVERFVREHRDVLEEITKTAAAKVDDGPATWYDSLQGQQDEQDSLAQRMGLQVIDYLEGEVNQDLKRDSLPYASFYPAGDDPNFSPSVSDPDSVWRAFSTAVAETSGNVVIDWLGAESAMEHNRTAGEGFPEAQQAGRDPGRTYEPGDFETI